MKRLLLSLVCLASSFAAFSQANVTSTAISVQGIARNSSNNAVSNSSISVTAELFYYNATAPTTPVTILSRTGTVNTDAFGVFAYVVDISNSDFIKITNTEAWIKISSGGTTFAQEKLMTVPYALHAQNGAPTGSIMPYVGSTAPAGWLLCDGSQIPTGDAYAALKKILGNGSTDATNVPDLRGMFIRGAGTNQVSNYTGYVGPTLKDRQADAVKNHLHDFTSNQATTSTTGDHSHELYAYQGGSTSSTVSRVALRTSVENPSGGNDDAPYGTTGAGQHSHTVTVSGTTNNNTNGATENRPANYGVNYIIKI
jgi:microcystin-dependent protein